MSNPLIENIISMDFEAAARLAETMHVDQLVEQVLEFAFQEYDIRCYTFATLMIAQKETWEWHYLAAMVLCQPLCHLNHAYFAAYYHAQRAIELAPNDDSLKEFILFFHCVPDRPMPDDLAFSIATGLLTSQPENKAALGCLNDLKMRRKSN
jgi:hypothetical protein